MEPCYTHQEVACPVSVCQSGDRTCPKPHVRSLAKQGAELGCPGAAPAWPRRCPTILWRAEACPLSRICWGMAHGKLLRYKLFLIFQILFKRRAIFKPAHQVSCGLVPVMHPMHRAGSDLCAAASVHHRGSCARGALCQPGLSSQPCTTSITPASQEGSARKGRGHQPAPRQTRRSTAELQALLKQQASLTLRYRHANWMLTRKDNLAYKTLWTSLPRNGSACAKPAGATACHRTCHGTGQHPRHRESRSDQRRGNLLFWKHVVCARRSVNPITQGRIL